MARDIYQTPDFGNIVTSGIDEDGDLVEVKESYYGDKLHSMQVTKTRVIKADGFLDAAEKALRETHRLMSNKICHDSITIKLDIDPKTMDISRLHVTHVPNKEHLQGREKLN